jgi:hypothetical protein
MEFKYGWPSFLCAQKGVLMSEYRPVDLSRESVNNLVITCADFRFQEAFMVSSVGNYEIDEADRLIYPAPSIAVADGTLMPAIEKLHALHGFEEVDIFDHIDCGGFGGLKAFEGVESLEAQEHFKFLKLAKEVIRQSIPELRVRGHVLGAQHELVIPAEEESSFSYQNDGSMANFKH